MAYRRRPKRGRSGAADPERTGSEPQGIIKELEAVKRLLVLLLAKLGAESPEIGMALGVDQSTVRRLIQFRSVKKIAP